MTYFVDGFDVTSKKDVLRWIREDFYGDKWGWAMSWAFNIAAELYNRNDSLPFDSYRPGACIEQHVDEYCADGLAEIPSDTLYGVGKVINRYLQFCKHNGIDY